MQKHSTQRGVVAIIVGLALAVLVAFAGLVLDLGRLYVNKSELQNAADACALAAAAELKCDASVAGPCPASYLSNAENAGVLTAGRSRHDLQKEVIAIAPADIRFNIALSPNTGYRSRTDGALATSRFAMCIARANGIPPWFMGVLGVPESNVSAAAVATLAPSRNFCSAAPIGICRIAGAGAPNYGYSVGEWISSSFTSSGANDALSGGFVWVDFTPDGGGDSELRDELAGSLTISNIKIGDNIQEMGPQQGAKSAWNTLFGIYTNGANAYTAATAPPDRSGYAYPNKSPGSPVIAIGTSAYADYRTRQGSHTPFIPAQYGVSGSGGDFAGAASATADHATYGKERRLAAVSVLDCGGPGAKTIQAVACVLLLNPMSNGASGTLYMEYRGPANAPGSPCATCGSPGGASASGPLVPTLVQ